MVVADETAAAVGVRADDGDRLAARGIEGQQPVVFEQHTGAQRRVVRKLQVLAALDRLVGDCVVFAALAAEDAQQKAGREHADRAAADVLLRDQAALEGGKDVLIGAAAVEIAAGLERLGDGLRGLSRDLVVFMEVPDRPAVRDEVALEAPLAAQLAHQRVAGAAGLAVRAVVGAHHGLDLRLLHERAEGGQIGLLHVLRRGEGVEAVAQGLGPAVDGEVLGAGRRFERFARSLQAAHEGAAEPGCQIRVLPVGLVAASPAGIAENIDVGRPHRQPVIDVSVTLGREGVVLGPGFRRDRRGDLFEQLVVEHGGHADRLREARRRALVPPVVGGDAQTLDGGRVKAELRGRFRDAHAADQLFGFSFCLLTRHRSVLSFPDQSCRTDSPSNRLPRITRCSGSAVRGCSIRSISLAAAVRPSSSVFCCQVVSRGLTTRARLMPS